MVNKAGFDSLTTTDICFVGFRAGITEFIRARMTGFRARMTGFRARMTGFRARVTGFWVMRNRARTTESLERE